MAAAFGADVDAGERANREEMSSPPPEIAGPAGRAAWVDAPPLEVCVSWMEGVKGVLEETRIVDSAKKNDEHPTGRRGVGGNHVYFA